MGKEKKQAAVKEYVHEARAASRARLNTVAGLSYEILKKNLIEKKDVLVDGKIIETTSSQTPTSAELYLFDFVNHVCTHCPEIIRPSEDDPVYSVIPGVPWEMFCEITLAGTKGQKELMQEEITRFSKSTPGRVINLKRGTVRTALFFVTLDSKKKNLNSRELQRLAALKYFPIETIDVRFVRELFESVLTGKNDYSNMPIGWHAKIRKQTESARELTGMEEADIDIHAGTYEKIWAYLNDHDNGMGSEKMINVWHMLVNTTGLTYVKIKNDGFYLRSDTGHNGYVFLSNVLRTLMDVSHEYRENLNFEITGLGVSSNVFDMKKLENAKKICPPELINKTIIDTMIKEYGGYIKITVKRNPKLAQAELPFLEDKSQK